MTMGSSLYLLHNLLSKLAPKVNKKEAYVLLSFNGNLDTDATLILSVPSRLIENYTGPPISAELPVTAKRAKQVHISEPSLLIYTDTDKIQLSPNGSVVRYESFLQKTGLAANTAEGKVYWSEHDLMAMPSNARILI